MFAKEITDPREKELFLAQVHGAVFNGEYELKYLSGPPSLGGRMIAHLVCFFRNGKIRVHIVGYSLCRELGQNHISARSGEEHFERESDADIRFNCEWWSFYFSREQRRAARRSRRLWKELVRHFDTICHAREDESNRLKANGVFSASGLAVLCESTHEKSYESYLALEEEGNLLRAFDELAESSQSVP